MRKKILIIGGTGFIGRQLCKSLLKDNYRVVVLTRSRKKALAVLPTPCVVVENLGEITAQQIPDAVINLAGAAIADQYWSSKRKHLLRESRIKFTQDLVGWLLENCPNLKVMVSGSAVGYYGSQDGSLALNEHSEAVAGFTHQLCKDWEDQSQRLVNTNCRVCLLRTGIVLGKNGGALAKMLPAFNCCLGGPVASGHQFMSWVHMDDMVRAIKFLLENNHAQGPYNITAPNAVSNLVFSETLAQVLHRPAAIRVSVFIIRLLLGEGAELLLQGQRVIPERLLAAGFNFKYPHLKSALTAIIKK